MTDAHDPSAPRPSDDAVFAAAAVWFARLRDGQVDKAAQSEYQAWRRADPRHAAAMADAERLWGRLELPVRRLAAPAPRSGPFERRTLRRVAAAAGLLLVLGLGALCRDDISVRLHSDYRTMVGMRTPVDLADGSRITLNTDTAIAVDMSGERRRVLLFRGEAWFDVAADASRPFVVETPMGDVRVVGTRFNLRASQGGTSVSLTEGQVDLTGRGGATLTLTPGQAVRLTAAGISRPETFDQTAVTAWLRGQFVFYDSPLADVVAEINRYRAGRIVIAGDRLRNLKVSGVFRTDDPDAALATITDTLPLGATYLTDFLVVLH
jgi:transmembrane sensor